MRVDVLGTELRRVSDALDRLREDVDEMAKADQIAHAVARELEQKRRARFTIGRKAAAAVAAVVVLVPALHDAFLWWGLG